MDIVVRKQEKINVVMTGEIGDSNVVSPGKTLVLTGDDLNPCLRLQFPGGFLCGTIIHDDCHVRNLYSRQLFPYKTGRTLVTSVIDDDDS